jgi:hypothetical protein
LSERLAEFIRQVSGGRKELEIALRERAGRGQAVRERIRNDVAAAASSLGLAHLPANVFERLAGL